MTTADELRAMLDKARRYIASAAMLRAQGDFDSALSRLYYAMFYCAEALLMAEGQAYSSHKAVIAAYGQYFVKSGRLPIETHQWLRESFDKRQIGDYDFIPTLTDADAADLSDKAQRFAAMAEGFLKRHRHIL